METIWTIVEGKMRNIPVLTIEHLTVLDRILTIGYPTNLPAELENNREAANKVIEDLIELGWVRPEIRTVAYAGGY